MSQNQIVRFSLHVIVLLLANHVAASNSCTNLFKRNPDLFVEGDFGKTAAPLSPIIQGHSFYIKWITESSNWVANSFNDGQLTSEQIFEFLGASRKQLSEIQNDPSGRSYGEKRRNDADSAVANTRVKDRLNRFILNRLKAAGNLLPWVDRVRGQVYARWETTPLQVIIDGKKIDLSKFYYEEFSANVLIYHTPPKHIEALMTEVARISHELVSDSVASQTSFAKSKMKRQFLYAMYLYYNAMPFTAGSSAIGRAYFGGLALAAFGKKLSKFQEPIDVYAMVMTFDRFAELYSDIL